MLDFNKDTPVLFLIFNRPDKTRLVFEKIKKASPSALYVAADGPRSLSEKEICESTRAILNEVDWDCEIKTFYRDENLGCRKAVSEALNWFFAEVEYGIVLEDDCLPADSFFGFCSALLAHYKDDKRIGHIAGINFQNGNIRGNGSYYFSRLTHICGWASWRRVWKEYDVEMSSFQLFEQLNEIKKIPGYADFENYWIQCFKGANTHQINTWDYQYGYLNIIANRSCIIPNNNLVTNIGVGADSTHTNQHPFQNIPFEEISTIIHPTFFIPDSIADIYSQRIEYGLDIKKKKHFNLKQLFKSKSHR